MVIFDLKVRILLLDRMLLRSLGLDIIDCEYSKCKCCVGNLFCRSEMGCFIVGRIAGFCSATLAILTAFRVSVQKSDNSSKNIVKRPILQTRKTDDTSHRKT